MSPFEDRRIRNREPVLFRLAKAMTRRRIRGGFRLLRMLREAGMLDRAVDYEIAGGYRIAVPIGRNGYDAEDLREYETEFLEALGEELRAISGAVTMVDGGSDIGVFSLKMLSLCPDRIRRIAAFEPNKEGYIWLKRNLERLNIPAAAYNSAISDFAGGGRLEAPERQWTPGIETNHTQMYLVSSPGGPIDVVTVDSVLEGPIGNLLIKLDLEGGERSALRGARESIQAASSVIVAIEAHPAVSARTGADPVESLRFLSSIRPFHFYASETKKALDPNTPVFEQVPPDRVYNVIGRSV